MSEWRNKKVERFTQKEYDKFWQQYVRKQVKYICDICNKPIQKQDMVTHMERNHDQKYDQHDRDVENRLGDSNRKIGDTSD